MAKVILKDKYAIETVSLMSMGEVQTTVADVATLQALKDKLTADNLSAVTTTNDAGLEVGHYEDQVLNPDWTIRWQEKGGLLVTFGLHDKTEIEKLQESRAVQDGAISDLGTAVSEIAEGGNA